MFLISCVVRKTPTLFKKRLKKWEERTLVSEGSNWAINWSTKWKVSTPLLNICCLTLLKIWLGLFFQSIKLQKYIKQTTLLINFDCLWWELLEAYYFHVSIIIFEWSYGRNKNIGIQNLKRRLGTRRSRLVNRARNVDLGVLRANQSAVLFVGTCRNVRVDWTWWAS
jgi:hypothetical protein